MIRDFFLNKVLPQGFKGVQLKDQDTTWLFTPLAKMFFFLPVNSDSLFHQCSSLPCFLIIYKKFTHFSTDHDQYTKIL